MYVCIYIYIYRERDIHTHTHTRTYTHISSPVEFSASSRAPVTTSTHPAQRPADAQNM